MSNSKTKGKGEVYVLDVSRWRCGGWSDAPKTRLGIGVTRFINPEGFMCCLGQFAAQKLKTRGKSRDSVTTILSGFATPRKLADSLKVNYDPNFAKVSEYDKSFFNNTPLATTLIGINDAHQTTVKEKIKQIRETLKDYGHTLRVINQHYIP